MQRGWISLLVNKLLCLISTLWRWCEGESNIFPKSIHPLSIPTYSNSGSRGSAGAYPSSLWAKGSGRPWTDHQSITGPHIDKQPCTLTSTPTGNIEPPMNLAGMSLGGSRRTWRKQAQGEHANTGRPLLGFKPGTFLLWGNGANHQATVLPSLQNICPKYLFWTTFSTLTSHCKPRFWFDSTRLS